MKIHNIILFLGLLGITLLYLNSCDDENPYDYYRYEDPFFKSNDEADTTTLPSGLKYMVSNEGGGEKPVAHDKVYTKLYYWEYVVSGNTYPNTMFDPENINFILDETAPIIGLNEGLKQMKEGSKYRFIIPPSLAYGADAKGSIPPYATLIYDIELHSFKHPREIIPFDCSGKDTSETGSGLKYIVSSTGKGKDAKDDRIAKVRYTGYLEYVDVETIFESTYKFDETYEFEIKKGKVIDGWYEGIKLMEEGDKYRFIIPPELAYGEQPQNDIPANSTLIFDIHLLELKRN